MDWQAGFGKGRVVLDRHLYILTHTSPSCTRAMKRTQCGTVNACGILSSNSISGEIIVSTDGSGMSSFIRFYFIWTRHICADLN